jgi:hypothetical protein
MTRTLLGTITLVALFACGGGGGSGGPQAPAGPGPSTPPPAPGNTGSITVTVVDALGDPVPFAEIQIPSESAGRSGRAGGDGRAAFSDIAAGRVDVLAYRVGDEDVWYSGTASSDLAVGGHVEIRVVATPTGNPAFATTRPIVGPSGVSADGRSLTFRLTLESVVTSDWDGYGFAVNLAPCVPDATNDSGVFRADCVEGAAGFDSAYDVAEPSTSVVTHFEETGSSQPYAAALLVDQSRHIVDSDRWNRRLFGIKHFVGTLDDEQVSLSAFAADEPDGGQAAQLPNKPVTVVAEQLDASDYAAIDNLAALEAGAAPLADALDRTIDRIAALPLPVGHQRYVVALTDGRDDTCGTADQCRLARQTLVDKSTAMEVAVMLLVLPGGGEADRRNVADLVTASGGRAFWLEGPEQIPMLLGNLGPSLQSSGNTADVLFRIESGTAGTFVSGRTVRAEVNVEICPWDCYVWSLPIAVRIP